MTSDEAVKILTSQWGGCSDALGLVVALESLGVLKIDRPRANDKLLDALNEHGYSFLKPDVLYKSLEKAGLQIIEKGQ